MVDEVEFDLDRTYVGDEDLIDPLHDDVFVGSVANINPVKDLDTLIWIAARARTSNTRITYIVIGPVFHRRRRYPNKLIALANTLGVDYAQFVGRRAEVIPTFATDGHLSLFFGR